MSRLPKYAIGCRSHKFSDVVFLQSLKPISFTNDYKQELIINCTTKDIQAIIRYLELTTIHHPLKPCNFSYMAVSHFSKNYLHKTAFCYVFQGDIDWANIQLSLL